LFVQCLPGALFATPALETIAHGTN
jgi:hypothetical protein